MKRSALVLLAVVAVPAVAHASATDIYITQSGGAAGACAANVQTPAFFNSASNWGSGASQIGPGTTVHLCGTFSGSTTESLLVAQGGGSPTQKLTLLFDQGATLTSPAWPAAGNPGGGALDFSQSHDVVVDGAGTGIIENSANGTGLANHQQTLAIAMDGTCDDCEVKNLTIQNLYVHIPGGCDDSSAMYGEAADHTQMNAIRLGQGTGKTVDHVVIHDVGWAILSNASQTVIGPGVDIYAIDHGFVFGAPSGQTIEGVVFYGNYVHDYAVWDDSQDCNHHDGIHGFGTEQTGTVVTDFWAYDNIFGGPTGSTMNQQIFLEGNAASTPWTTSDESNSYVFNNYFSATVAGDGGAPPAIVSASTVGNAFFVNNTVVGNYPTVVNACTAFGGEASNSPKTTVANNAIQGCSALVASNGDTTDDVVFNMFDYNAYANCSGYNCFFASFGTSAVDSSSFSAWQSGSGLDTHSISSSVSVGFMVPTDNFFQLNADAVPQSGSPLAAAGTNLSSYCSDSSHPLLAALCSDLAGNPRPSGTAAWGIGAYELCTGSSCVYPDGGIATDGGVVFTDASLPPTDAGGPVDGGSSGSGDSGKGGGGSRDAGKGSGSGTGVGPGHETDSGPSTGSAPEGGANESPAPSSGGCDCSIRAATGGRDAVWVVGPLTASFVVFRRRGRRRAKKSRAL